MPNGHFLTKPDWATTVATSLRLLYTPKKPEHPFMEAGAKVRFHRPHRPLHTILPSVWRSYWMGSSIKNDKLHLYHGLSHELPRNIGLASIPTVVTMHDLIFERFPELYPWLDRKLYAQKYRFSVQEASHIVAISEQTKQDLMDYYAVPESKVTVVYQNCNPAFAVQHSQQNIDSALQHYHIHGRYILYVGALTERKQVLTLVQAFHEARLHDMKLVLVGSGSHYRNQILDYIRTHKLAKHVYLLSHVDAHYLPALYQGASLFVYPSLFEGFGIPIIEALTSGVPVITTEGGCFPEAGGPNSLYVSPGNVEALSAAIKKILNNEALAQRMIAAGKEYAQQFSAENFARNTMQVYQKLLG